MLTGWRCRWRARGRLNVLLIQLKRIGDLILTGTPTGAGARFDPPRWLKAGDVVEIEVPEIGVLRNAVADT